MEQKETTCRSKCENFISPEYAFQTEPRKFLKTQLIQQTCQSYGKQRSQYSSAIFPIAVRHGQFPRTSVRPIKDRLHSPPRPPDKRVSRQISRASRSRERKRCISPGMRVHGTSGNGPAYGVIIFSTGRKGAGWRRAGRQRSPPGVFAWAREQG